MHVVRRGGLEHHTDLSGADWSSLKQVGKVLRACRQNYLVSVEDGSCNWIKNKPTLEHISKLPMNNLHFRATCICMTMPPVTQFRCNLNIESYTPRMKEVNTGRNLSSNVFSENQQTKTILVRESKKKEYAANFRPIFFSLSLYLYFSMGLAFCPKKRITPKKRKDLEARVSCASGVCDVMQRA